MHYSGVVLDVILSSAVDQAHVDSSVATPSLGSAISRADNPADVPAYVASTSAPADPPAYVLPTNAPADAPPTNVLADAPSTNVPADALPTSPPVDAHAKSPTNRQSDPSPPGAITDMLHTSLPSRSSAKGSGRSFTVTL